jgi:hypothetical protein
VTSPIAGSAEIIVSMLAVDDRSPTIHPDAAQEHAPGLLLVAAKIPGIQERVGDRGDEIRKGRRTHVEGRFAGAHLRRAD